MKKIVLCLFAMISLEIQAQEVEIIPIEELSTYLKDNKIPVAKRSKFWEVLDRNYISYTPNDKWIVESDTATYVFDNNDYPYNPEYGALYGHLSPLNRKFGMLLGRLSHQDGKCLLAMNTAPIPINGKKLQLPLREDLAKEYVFTQVGNNFEFGKPYRSMRRQAIKDVQMLVTHYPAETAKNIFNGVSMFIYPLNFQGETYLNQYTCGRGVVIFSEHNVPLELYFFMTDESIADFDEYLLELKGVFTFQNESIDN